MASASGCSRSLQVVACSQSQAFLDHNVGNLNHLHAAASGSNDLCLHHQRRAINILKKRIEFHRNVECELTGQLQSFS